MSGTSLSPAPLSVYFLEPIYLYFGVLEHPMAMSLHENIFPSVLF